MQDQNFNSIWFHDSVTAAVHYIISQVKLLNAWHKAQYCCLAELLAFPVPAYASNSSML